MVSRLIYGLALFTWSCAEFPPSELGEDELRQLVAMEGMHIDSVGVRNLAQGDTLVDYSPLIVIETTFKIPRQAEGGEVFAWEFYAEQLNPVKLLVVRDANDGEHYEIVGESETFVPAHKGINRHILREPIPVAFKDMVGLVQPGEATVPFRKVVGWKTLISARPLQRPFIPRDRFAMYGWRYSMRVLWRVKEEGI